MRLSSRPRRLNQKANDDRLGALAVHPCGGQRDEFFFCKKGDLAMRHSIHCIQGTTRTTHRLALVVGIAILGATGMLAAAAASAQDAVKVDAKHYKVEFENDQVRVLRVHYGPHEKSVMHSHPADVAVFLTDGSARFTMPDGKTQDEPVKVGSVSWSGPTAHLPENVGDKAFELIVVELKSKPVAAKK